MEGKHNFQWKYAKLPATALLVLFSILPIKASFASSDLSARPSIADSLWLTEGTGGTMVDQWRNLANERRSLFVKKDYLKTEIGDILSKLSAKESQSDAKDRIDDLEKKIKDIRDENANNRKQVASLHSKKNEKEKILDAESNKEDGDTDKVEELQAEIASTVIDIEELERTIKSKETDIKDTEKSRDSKERELKETSSLHDKLKKIKKELNGVELSMLNLDAKMISLIEQIDNDNEFRLRISFSFTGLVAVVIIFFYIVSLRNKEVAMNIFSGDRGIQFITLFLIVIAIILFGIMGTLQSRELAALLGALSGYILGKTTERPREESQKSQPPPAKPEA